MYSNTPQKQTYIYVYITREIYNNASTKTEKFKNNSTPQNNANKYAVQMRNEQKAKTRKTTFKQHILETKRKPHTQAANKHNDINRKLCWQSSDDKNMEAKQTHFCIRRIEQFACTYQAGITHFNIWEGHLNAIYI